MACPPVFISGDVVARGPYDRLCNVYNPDTLNLGPPYSLFLPNMPCRRVPQRFIAEFSGPGVSTAAYVTWDEIRLPGEQWLVTSPGHWTVNTWQAQIIAFTDAPTVYYRLLFPQAVGPYGGQPLYFRALLLPVT